jgi:hypothetical protein
MQLGNMRAVDVVWMLWMCLGMSHSQRGVCVGASVVHDVSGASLRPDVSSASLSLLVCSFPHLSLPLLRLNATACVLSLARRH